MQWEKKDLIYAPAGVQSWAKKYALPPVPLRVSDAVIRIYAGFCDAETVARVGFVEVSARDPRQVLRVSERPVFDIGTPGAFDDHGVAPTSIVDVDGTLYMYYVGFQLGTTVRYFQFQGLAISTDGGATFHRHRRVPIIDRSDQEALNRTSAFVMRENGVFRMWYVGGSEWTVGQDGKSLPVYPIRHLESADGKEWGPSGEIAIGLAGEDEHALGRPWVVRHRGRYLMFYSSRTRSKGYRIGYAESRDGLAWTRKDADIGIDVSPAGWDSTMIAYASVIERHGIWTMFYNGNNCGETGFGYADLIAW